MQPVRLARIDVGQVYASRTHGGYEVRVTKATERHVEGMVISNHEKGKRQYYRRYIFERSFDLIQDTKMDINDGTNGYERRVARVREWITEQLTADTTSQTP